MKRLQNKILRNKLKEIRNDPFFKSLPKKEQKLYWYAMLKLNEEELEQVKSDYEELEQQNSELQEKVDEFERETSN